MKVLCFLSLNEHISFCISVVLGIVLAFLLLSKIQTLDADTEIKNRRYGCYLFRTDYLNYIGDLVTGKTKMHENYTAM